jgi:phage baseplate assembly protein gpV
MIEEILDRFESSIHDAARKFYGVAVGTVTSQLDPMGLGRVQLKLPMIDSTDSSAWARVAVPMAGASRGTYLIPDVGDEVLVAFEHGDINAPYVIGALWNLKAPPPLPSPLPQIRTIRTQAGNEITITEIPATITISTPAGQKIVLSPTGIQITTGSSAINLTPDGITVSGTPNLTLTATAAINITAPNITVNGSAAATFQSGGVCNVTAPLVKVN